MFSSGCWTSSKLERRSLAYERTRLIVTTNLPFEEWTQIFSSDRIIGALMDRLTHRVHLLEANGESYRLREAQKRLKRTASQRIT